MELAAEEKIAAALSTAELTARVAELEKRVAAIEDRTEDRVTITVFSGDLDRVLAAFIIATGASAMGQQVSMFFTFWGSALFLRREPPLTERLYSRR
jgi:hypothetical protein